MDGKSVQPEGSTEMNDVKARLCAGNKQVKMKPSRAESIEAWMLGCHMAFNNVPSVVRVRGGADLT
jgi:hypothetical protein